MERLGSSEQFVRHGSFAGFGRTQPRCIHELPCGERIQDAQGKHLVNVARCLCRRFKVRERARGTKEFYVAQGARYETALRRRLPESEPGSLPGPPEKAVQVQFIR